MKLRSGNIYRPRFTNHNCIICHIADVFVELASKIYITLDKTYKPNCSCNYYIHSNCYNKWYNYRYYSHEKPNCIICKKTWD